MFLSGKMKALGLALLLSVAVSACGNNEMAKPVAAKPIPLTLEFFTMPVDIKVGKEVGLRLLVKRGDKVIQNAEVTFEIWKDGDDPSKHQKTMTLYGLRGMNYYEWQQTFTEPGLYHITLHTTVDDIHQMPTKDFVVTE